MESLFSRLHTTKTLKILEVLLVISPETLISYTHNISENLRSIYSHVHGNFDFKNIKDMNKLEKNIIAVEKIFPLANISLNHMYIFDFPELCKNNHINIISKLFHNEKDNINKNIFFHEKPLIVSINYGNIDICKFLISIGANTDILDERNNTPFQLSIIRGKLDIARFFLEIGTDINHTNFENDTPLLSLIDSWVFRSFKLENDIVMQEILNFLIINGADINKKNLEGQNSLMRACDNDNINTVNVLLSNGAKVNEIDNYGQNAFHIACNRSNKKIMNLLLKYGANINQIDNHGLTPLSHAYYNGDIDTFQFLIKNGADPVLSRSVEDKKFFDSCYNGWESLISFLLSSGYNLDEKIKIWGVTPIVKVCQYGNEEALKMLLENGANLKVSDQEEESTHMSVEIFNLSKGINKIIALNYPYIDKTFIIDACDIGDLETVELLLSMGFDPNTTKGEKKYNALNSLYWSHRFFVERKLEEYIDFDWLEPELQELRKSKILNTIETEKRNHLDILKLLLENGANPNSEYFENNLYSFGDYEDERIFSRGSALHLWSGNGCKEAIEMLLDYKADPNFTDYLNVTPLFRACTHGNLDAVKVLISRGADLNLSRKGGCTPLDISISEKHDEIVQLLKLHGAKEGKK